jgi:acyl carrier protein
MSGLSAAEVRTVILDHVAPQLAARGLKPEHVPDDFDLLTEGIIDSMGILVLISIIENHFEITVDMEDLDPEHLTVVGPLSRYFEQKTSRRGG